MALLCCLCEVLDGWRHCFVDHRTFRRAKEHALALLVSLGRRTISRSICVLGRQFRSWASEYRFFSRCRWKPHALFDAVLQQAAELLGVTQPLVIALDDTPCRKTGKRIRAAKTLRDPLSPPFHLNFCHALRFLQAAVLLWPQQAPGAARAIPVSFDLAPPVPKPKAPRRLRRKSSPADRAAYARACRAHQQALKNYRRQQRLEGLSAQGAKLLNTLRQRSAAITSLKDKMLWAVVDASFCNRTVFDLLDPGIVLIGRTRKDLRLYASPGGEAHRRGRKPRYGVQLPTPEQLRQDPSRPWKKCPIFAAGKLHQLHYKTLAPVLWRSGTATRPMRLIIIRPLRYRAHGHTLYRQPAYLLVNNPEVPLPDVLQAYFYRWEIEVDQKEEKDLLGVGQAQVWSDVSVARQPAFHVATYAALLLAAIKTYGMNTAAAAGRLPLWRRNKPPLRLSAAHLIANLRKDIEELEATQSASDRKKKGAAFLADVLRERFGKKFPITARTLLDSAWT
jgi:hypothetical protein